MKPGIDRAAAEKARGNITSTLGILQAVEEIAQELYQIELQYEGAAAADGVLETFNSVFRRRGIPIHVETDDGTPNGYVYAYCKEITG